MKIKIVVDNTKLPIQLKIMQDSRLVKVRDVKSIVEPFEAAYDCIPGNTFKKNKLKRAIRNVVDIFDIEKIEFEANIKEE